MSKNNNETFNINVKISKDSYIKLQKIYYNMSSNDKDIKTKDAVERAVNCLYDKMFK